MDSAKPGTIGGTYIGSPVSCAAALATIQFMKDEDLNAKGKSVGNKIMDRMKKVQSEQSSIGDVRGIGAMIGVEFVKNSDPRQPDGELCASIIKGCAEKGLIVLAAGTHKNIIRILCPLVITDEQLQKGLDVLEGEITNNTK
jgi:4-aminobutyrate aminotransferase/(S)-3-amino-2-methylpropionate transaminase